MAELINSITPAGRAQIEQAVSELIACEPEQAIKLAVAGTAEAANFPDSPDKEALLVALTAAANFGAGMKALQHADFATAVQNLDAAEKGFSTVGADEAHSISYAFFCFADGTRNALLLNLDRARELWVKAEQHLKDKGGIQERYRVLLDQFKPDQLYLAAIQLLIQQDFDGGRSIMKDASRAAIEFATRYLTVDDPSYRYLKGLSQYYLAYYNCVESYRDFTACGYDRIIANGDAFVAAAKSAEADLVLDAYPNEVQRRVAVLAVGVSRLQQILVAFAKLMQNVMLANFTREAPELADLRKQIPEAKNILGGLGPPGVPMIRQCEQLMRQVENVERLSRPTAKDFGVFSGFASAVAFVPLLLVTSWIFNQYSWGIPPVTFMWVNVGVAALVGFGAGALKLLPSMMAGGKSSK
jgi:hypothetical protein